jgi:O-antigen/teichoic acid export membrane protein
MVPKLLRAGAIYGSANVMAAGVPFLLLPILTRALSPTEYGEVVSFFMLVSVSAALAGLSLHGAVGVRWLDTRLGCPKSYTLTSVLLIMATTALAAVFSALLGPVAGFHLSPVFCAMAAVVAGCTSLQGVRFAIWQSQGRALPASILQVFSALMGAGFSLAAVLLFSWGSAGRIGGAVIASVLVAGVSLLFLARLVGNTKPSYSDASALLRFGLPLVPHAMAGSLLVSLDRLSVSSQLGVESLGIYGAAAQLGLVINVLADACLKAFTPQLYGMLARDTLKDRLCYVAVSYLSLPFWLLVALALWGTLLLFGNFILGSKYLSSTDLTLFFLLGGALTGSYLNVAGLFFFTGRTEWITAATLTACAIAALLAPFMVNHYGLRGGALTYCTGQIVLLLAAWIFSSRVKPMPWHRPVLALRVLIGSL